MVAAAAHTAEAGARTTAAGSSSIVGEVAAADTAAAVGHTEAGEGRIGVVEAHTTAEDNSSIGVVGEEADRWAEEGVGTLGVVADIEVVAGVDTEADCKEGKARTVGTAAALEEAAAGR